MLQGVCGGGALADRKMSNVSSRDLDRRQKETSDGNGSVTVVRFLCHNNTDQVVSWFVARNSLR